jgi:hypothetical protein
MAIITNNITTNSIVNFAPVASAWRRKHVFYIDGVLDGASVNVLAKDTQTGHGSAMQEHSFTQISSESFEGQPQFGWDFVVSNTGANTNISIGWY